MLRNKPEMVNRLSYKEYWQCPVHACRRANSNRSGSGKPCCTACIESHGEKHDKHCDAMMPGLLDSLPSIDELISICHVAVDQDALSLSDDGRHDQSTIMDLFVFPYITKTEDEVRVPIRNQHIIHYGESEEIKGDPWVAPSPEVMLAIEDEKKNSNDQMETDTQTAPVSHYPPDVSAEDGTTESRVDIDASSPFGTAQHYRMQTDTTADSPVNDPGVSSSDQVPSQNLVRSKARTPNCQVHSHNSRFRT